MRRGFSGLVEDFDKKSFLCLGKAVCAKCMFELDAKAAKVKPSQMKNRVEDVCNECV